MATQKPQIRAMFATPVCVHFLPVAQEVNVELRPLVIDRMNAAGGANPQGQGWSSEGDFESWGGVPAQTLYRMLRELADNLTSTRNGGRVTLEWTINASASV